MFKILEKQTLAPKIDMLEIHAPYIASHAKVGNFVVLRLNEKGERIPLTIADSNRKRGSITLLFQKIGKTTEQLGMLKQGDSIRDVAGPLGHPTRIKRYGTCVLIGGGIGAATLYPIAKALKKRGNNIIVILGARSKDFLVWEDKFKKNSHELLLTTDDGSSGRKGLVTDVFTEIMQKKSIALVIAVGPVKMMKAVADMTRPQGISTLVSLNPLMVEGTGMCGSCRVTIAGKTRFACIDGPEFDGHDVDFQGLEHRLGFYRKEEEKSYKLFLKRNKKGVKGSRGQGIK
ncbi:MAG: sulfide/dihydroorotate dehydrogenase-like FAD/NAD-binding protein [Nitrospiraceae bacterium]|nr:MAG: sulfide/dihydroorotate dehydrogenase-like FAD/NAD-binding protein [Nitrospiraceae bacterium]